jgi:hypothetical protein
MPKRLPYSREVLPKDDPEVILRERRGIRDFVLRFGSKEPRQPSDTARQLAAVARALLRKAGERSLDEVIENANATKANDPDEAMRTSLLSWYGDVAARRGVLSPITLAVKFLGIQYLVIRLTASSIDEQSSDADVEMERRINQILGLCDAWHWFHMEAFGEHDRAFSGMTSRKSLAKGPASLRATARARSEVIRSCISGSANVSSSELARHRFKTINNELARNNLQQFETQMALAKAIQRLRR